MFFQVGVALEAVFVEAEHAAGFRVVDAAVADRGFDVGAELRDQRFGVELDVVEHFADRVALDHRVEHDRVVVIQRDVHGVRVAEQVVEVAENLLIRADQEHAEVIRLAVERVQRQRFLDVAAVDELVDLAVRVARDVANHGVLRRTLVQPVDRHDREQLVDRPAVRNRLEQREVAEIRVGERLVEVLQILGHFAVSIACTSFCSLTQIAQYRFSAWQRWFSDR